MCNWCLIFKCSKILSNFISLHVGFFSLSSLGAFLSCSVSKLEFCHNLIHPDVIFLFVE